MARYGANVPTDDFSVNGQRVAYSARYRGQEVMLYGTAQARRWDRNYGQNVWRITPDALEDYGNLTHFDVSILEKDVVKV